VTAAQIAADMLRQETARLRHRIVFYHSCADDPELRRESREASRIVADALARLLAGREGSPADRLDGPEIPFAIGQQGSGAR
jgi:hypothetical protein